MESFYIRDFVEASFHVHHVAGAKSNHLIAYDQCSSCLCTLGIGSGFSDRSFTMSFSFEMSFFMIARSSSVFMLQSLKIIAESFDSMLCKMSGHVTAIRHKRLDELRCQSSEVETVLTSLEGNSLNETCASFRGTETVPRRSSGSLELCGLSP